MLSSVGDMRQWLTGETDAVRRLTEDPFSPRSERRPLPRLRCHIKYDTDSNVLFATAPHQPPDLVNFSGGQSARIRGFAADSKTYCTVRAPRN